MIIQDSLKKFGDYVLLMRRVFTIPDRWREFFKRYISEIYKLGIDSIPIVITILCVGSHRRGVASPHA